VIKNDNNTFSSPTVIYVLGEMSYRDIFSAKRHSTKFCLQTSFGDFPFFEKEIGWISGQGSASLYSFVSVSKVSRQLPYEGRRISFAMHLSFWERL
jgi:hypothetical protein